MKRVSALFFLIFLFSMPCLSFASNEDFSTSEWMPGHLMVNFIESVGTLQNLDGSGQVITIGIPEVDELFQRYHVTAMNRIIPDETLSKLKFIPDFYRFMLLTCPEHTDILEMMREFEKNKFVDTADPDLLRRTYDATPNDALWSSQWDKRLMDCPRAWEYTTGSQDILVVAIDSGTDWPHPDLHDNLWVNPGEDINGDGLLYTDDSYPGDLEDLNGIDDDGNGKVDDLIGWDFISGIGGCAPGEDCSTPDNDPFGVGEHGTHVAGLMAAVGNNGIGVTGVNWHVKLLASRAGYTDVNGNGFIPQSASFPCIPWAVALGARVVNMSYGGPTGGSQEANIMTAAWNNGAILVGAAGNDHVSSIHYPAGHPHVVSVGSVDQDDQVSSFSNYGTWVDVFAPGGGGGVISTWIPGYSAIEGTSMASPNCAGVLALLWSLFPDLSNQQVIDLMQDHCDDITAVNPDYAANQLGHGRVNAALPIGSVYPYLTVVSNQISSDTDNDGRLEAGETGNLSISVNNEAGWSDAAGLVVTFSSSDPNITLTDETAFLGDIAGGQTINNSGSPAHITVSVNIPSAYWTTITANLETGSGFMVSRSFQIRIGRPQNLVVADAGIDNFQNYFKAALLNVNGEGAGYDFDEWSTATNGQVTFGAIHEYQNIIWVCGNDSVTSLSADDQSALTQFLDGGGHLLLAGQGIDEDTNVNSSALYSNYLHAQSTTLPGGRNLTGVASDPISDGANLLLIGGGCGGNGNVGPSQIVPINGGIGFYTYNSGGIGAIRYENSTYKTAYFAFAIEAACGLNNTTHHSVIIHRLMEWFGATLTSADDHHIRTVPSSFALKGNYPNPFNPNTTIEFDLATSAKISLKVYDLQGREVANLVDAALPAGSHKVNFDGSNLASGIYFARLEAGKFNQTQRMVLLK